MLSRSITLFRQSSSRQQTNTSHQNPFPTCPSRFPFAPLVEPVLAEGIRGEGVLGEAVPGEAVLGEAVLGEAVPGEVVLGNADLVEVVLTKAVLSHPGHHLASICNYIRGLHFHLRSSSIHT